jgi:glycerol uptake facilitator-like aquaporin
MYRKKIGMLFAETLGTAVLTTVALNVSRSDIGSVGAYFTAIAVALTLGVMVLVLGNASGSHLNPAVTAGLWTIRKIPTLQAVAYVGAQFLGALCAWRLFEYMTQRPVENIANATFDWRVLIAEALGTMIFTFGIASVIYQRYEGLRAAATVGTSLLVGILIASVASNAVINPAVAVGIRSLSLAYMVGPLVGAIVGSYAYALLYSDEKIGLPVIGSRRNKLPAKTPVAPSSDKKKKK